MVNPQFGIWMAQRSRMENIIEVDKQEMGGTKANSGSVGGFGFKGDENSCSAAIMSKKGKR